MADASPVIGGRPETARRRPAARRRSHPLTPPVCLLLLLVASAVASSMVGDDVRRLLVPVLVMVSLAGLYFTVLWRRDGELPVFEIGSLWVAATLVYSAMPFLNFLLDGLQWTSHSDGRLQRYPFDLDAVAAFAWRYVAYLASFVVVYLLLRGRHTAAGARLALVPRWMPLTLLVVLLLQRGWERLMNVAYGVDLAGSTASAYTNPEMLLQPVDMPYPFWQITLIAVASVLLVKLGLLLVLIRWWGDLRWRLVLLAWLAFEVVSVAVEMGARGSAVRLLLAFAVLYHRFVRPLRPFWLLVAGGALLAAFQAQGILRGRTAAGGGLDLHTLLTSTNEFQVLFATAYDLYQRQLAGTLPEVPWQVYVSDLYMIIPSQLLPFEKLDPASWYLEVIGVAGSGVGFMFGVMAQAVLGWDWIELVARGALLGLLLALLHRWYVRHATRFWPTLLYLFVTVWCYYTVRASTFYIVHFVVYQFVPVMILATLLNLAWSRRRPATARA